MGSVIPEVIRRYNDELDDAAAAEAHGLLVEGLRRDGLVFGDRLLCNVLRPQLLTESEYASIGTRSALVLGAIERTYAAFQTTAAIRDALALTELETAALGVRTGFQGATPFARLDSFLDHESGTLRFVEYNAETPAGVAYEDALGKLFLELPPVQRLAASTPVRLVEGSATVLDTLLGVAAEAGLAPPHAIGIVDWDDVPTRPEFELFAKAFAARGVPTWIGSPHDLSYTGGVLRLRGHPTTIVYKRVLGREFLEECGLDHPLVHALNDGAAVMANPFQCRVLHKKALFAVLTDEAHAGLFSAAQRDAIQAHVPWTRRVEDRATTFRGQTIDLLPWVEAHREELVLKPNDDYGGRGVVLGWDVDAAGWQAAMRTALDAPTVVQERVATAFEPFPVWDGSRLAIEPRLVDLDPYCYHGRTVHGVLTRLSAGSLLNVTAGTGSVAPTFILGG